MTTLRDIIHEIPSATVDLAGLSFALFIGYLLLRVLG